MKNVLAVYNIFRYGGTERYLYNMREALKDDVHYSYMLGPIYDNGVEPFLLDGSSVYPFEDEYTIESFIHNIEQIKFIVEHEKIDVIQPQNVKSLIPSVIAACLTNRPVLYNVHGKYSFGSAQHFNEKILFHYFVTDLNMPLITQQDADTKNIALHYHNTNITQIPNMAIFSQFEENHAVFNQKWLLVSRLSKDKTSEIELLLKNLEALNIAHLDIAGDGDNIEYIKNLIEPLGLVEKVTFLGYKTDISALLSDGYNGIIGCGQVALEGIASNLPVLLIGHGKITGLIDKDLFDQINTRNMTGFDLPSKPIAETASEIAAIKETINKYLISDYVKQFRDASATKKAYLNLLDAIKPLESKRLIDLYEDAKLLEKKQEKYRTSQKFYDLLRKNIVNFTINPNILMCEELRFLAKDNSKLKKELKKTTTELEETKEQLLALTESISQLNAETEEKLRFSYLFKKAFSTKK